MKNCPTCGTANNDESMFCISCGTKLDGAQAQPQAEAPAATAFQPDPAQGAAYQQPQSFQPAYAPVAVDPADHTAEFDPKDISDNKPLAMLIYLGGIIGALAGVIFGKKSPYVEFHTRQFLKLWVLNIIIIFFNIIPFIGWLAYVVCFIILKVLAWIGFFSVCKGNAKELPIVKNLGFLN